MSRQLDPSRVGDHIDRLFRAAWGLTGSREEAEDLVQETYVRVLAKPRFLRNDDDLGYLLRVLRNTHVARWRRQRARVTTETLDESAEELIADPRGATPADRLESKELFATIAALPDDFREVLVAVDVTGLSYKETAKALKVPEGTVMSRLYRARKQVAQAIGETDV